MRLVALTLLLWADCWEAISNGRKGMDIDAIAERTSLTEDQVRMTLTKLENVRLIQQRADGWVLTLDDYRAVVLDPFHDRNCVRRQA